MKNYTHFSLPYLSESPHHAAAIKWLFFWHHPEDKNALDQLGSEVDQLMFRLCPRGKVLGGLLDSEPDIRQEASLLLYQRYFAGNKELMDASSRQNIDEITEQIRRSIWVAIKVTIWRYRKKLRRWQQLFESTDVIDELVWSAQPHPAEHRHLEELPLDEQLQLVRAVLIRAVHEKRLSEENVSIALELLNGGVSQADLAKFLGVSRQAINQRLRPVRRYLQTAIHDQEFSIS